jgi:hypothetical protein
MGNIAQGYGTIDIDEVIQCCKGCDEHLAEGEDLYCSECKAEMEESSCQKN